MRLCMALLAVAPACGFHSAGPAIPIPDDGDVPIDDVRIDDTPIPIDAQLCFGSFLNVCFDAPEFVPTAAVTFAAGASINSDATNIHCDQHNNRKAEYCVVIGQGITLPAAQTLRAYGGKPLVLLSTTTITLEALSVLDVSSNHGTVLATGAGANPAACVAGTDPEMAGGSFGGSFGGKGGDGERLSGSSDKGVASAALSAAPNVLRGGCAGGRGGMTSGLGGSGGSGGGAVLLSAGMAIQLDGKINASGSGGHGGLATKSGGGGGGSGGMVVLAAPTVAGAGVIFANGGGGGQGGTGGAMAAVGGDGGESVAPETAALGGTSLGEGGIGGAGSFGPSKLGGFSAMGGQSGMGGGGAGGGGAGFVRGNALPATLIIAPPAMDLPPQ